MNTPTTFKIIWKILRHEMAILCHEKVYFSPFLSQKGLLWDEKGQKSYRKGLLSSRFWLFLRKKVYFGPKKVYFQGPLKEYFLILGYSKSIPLWGEKWWFRGAKWAVSVRKRTILVRWRAQTRHFWAVKMTKMKTEIFSCQFNLIVWFSSNYEVLSWLI